MWPAGNALCECPIGKALDIDPTRTDRDGIVATVIESEAHYDRVMRAFAEVEASGMGLVKRDRR